MFLASLRAAGMVAADSNLLALADVSAHTVRSLYRTYLNIQPLTEASMQNCKDEILRRTHFLVDHILVAEEAEASDAFCLAYVTHASFIEPRVFFEVEPFLEGWGLLTRYHQEMATLKKGQAHLDKAWTYLTTAPSQGDRVRH